MSETIEELFGEINLLSPEEMKVSREEQPPATPVEGEEEVTAQKEKEENEFFIKPASSQPTSEVTPETKEIKTDEAPEDPPASSSDGNDSVYLIQAKALVEQGIWDEEDISEFDGSKESYLTIQQNRESKMADSIFDNWKKSLTPKQQKVLGLMEEGLSEDIAETTASKLERYTSISEEDLTKKEDVRRSLIKEDFISRGYSEEEADELTTDIFDLGKDEDKAKKALSSLTKSTEKLVEAEKERVKEQTRITQENVQKEFQNLQNDIESLTEVIPGIKATKAHKDKLLKSFTEPVAKDERGNPLNSVQANRMKNPMAWEKAVHTLNMLGAFNIDDKGNWVPDFSKLKVSAKTSALEELEKKIKESKRTGGSPANNAEESGSSELLSALSKKINLNK